MVTSSLYGRRRLVCKHLPPTRSANEERDANWKQKRFIFKVKVAPFEMCWFQAEARAFTLKANLLHVLSLTSCRSVVS